MAKKLEIDPDKLRKLEELQKEGINPFPYTFSQTHHAQEINQKYASLNQGDHTKDVVAVAGRIMLRRIMGKASFFHLQDQTGKMQIYLQVDKLGPELYDVLTKKTDSGDILGVQGTIFKTKMGEVTIAVEKAQILGKSLIVLPEKYHGLKDIELKYRQRYVDLFVNPEVRDVFIKRAKMLDTVREYFRSHGFLDVEMPVLQTVYGGASAKPFITHINAWKMNMYLSISPELFLKRLLVGGIERVFTICKNFRNEDVDPTHNPEFTMMEAYQCYADYNAMMEHMEQVYERACLAVNGTTKVKHKYRGEELEIDFKAPWKRMTMLEAIKYHADIDAAQIKLEHLQDLLRDRHIEYEGKLTWGLGVQRLFEELVEEKLVQPIHITDHPKESTPLCKVHRVDPRLIERFESFCLGMELSNAYSELNDPVLQRKLFEEQAKQLRAGNEEAHPHDDDFLHALEYGMPPAGGLGIGMDRMAVLLMAQDAIRDVILFPTVKPMEEHEKEEGKENKNKDNEK